MTPNASVRAQMADMALPLPLVSSVLVTFLYPFAQCFLVLECTEVLCQRHWRNLFCNI